MTLIAFAEQELLRVFRRRETFWTVFGLMGLGFLVLNAAKFGRQELEGDWMLGPSRLVVGEALRRMSLHAEALMLCVVCFYLGAKTMRTEIDLGSWVLLTQTPVTVTRIVMGKALGILLAAGVIHAVLTIPALSQVPLAPEGFPEAFLKSVLVLFLAGSFVPEGMLYGWMGRKRPILTYALYPLTVIRLGAIPILLLRAARLEDTSLLGHVLLLKVFYQSQFFNPPEKVFSEHFAHPALPIILVLGWMWGTAVVYGWSLARQAR